MEVNPFLRSLSIVYNTIDNVIPGSLVGRILAEGHRQHLLCCSDNSLRAILSLANLDVTTCCVTSAVPVENSCPLSTTVVELYTGKHEYPQRLSCTEPGVRNQCSQGSLRSRIPALSNMLAMCMGVCEREGVID